MKELLANVKTNMNKTFGRAVIKTKKASPEILLGLGIVGVVGTVVLACKATLRADDVLAFHNMKMHDIEDAKEVADEDSENELEYADKLYHQDIAVQYMKTAGNLAKLYAPAIALGTLSLACILTSRNIMQKRYLGAVAACNSLNEILRGYRKRVKEELGDTMDRHFRYGTDIEETVNTDTDENGKKVKIKGQIENAQQAALRGDDTSRFFDESNPNWDKNPQFSLMFLRGQQNILNDILHTRGHVFLNEVYDALGFEHTPQGAILGWIEGVGDDFIDFGLFDPNKDGVRRFVNGQDNVILLEFNHDGPIWDKI